MPVTLRKTSTVQQRVLENLNTCIMLTDQEFNINYLNPAGEMLFQLSSKKACQRKLAELITGPADLLKQIRDALATGRPFTRRALEIELVGMRLLSVDCTVTPVEEAGNTELLVELLNVDRQLRLSKEESLLEQGDASRALVRSLAHEIKNPLGGIRGAAQLLQSELATDEQKEYTQVIIAEADRMRQLVDRMLGPNAVPRRQQVNIHELLERVRTLVLAESNKSIVIHRDYDPSIPDFSADPDQLIQALLNLLRNAMQALDDNGEITLRSRVLRQFTIGRTRHKLVLDLRVSDNGPGIPPALIERIFLPMITGRSEGTGLGLSIAQSLVNRHKGLIECNSKPGHTVFNILLPLEQDA